MHAWGKDPGRWNGHPRTYPIDFGIHTVAHSLWQVSVVQYYLGLHRANAKHHRHCLQNRFGLSSKKEHRFAPHGFGAAEDRRNKNRRVTGSALDHPCLHLDALKSDTPERIKSTFSGSGGIALMFSSLFRTKGNCSQGSRAYLSDSTERESAGYAGRVSAKTRRVQALPAGRDAAPHSAGFSSKPARSGSAARRRGPIRRLPSAADARGMVCRA